MTLTKANIVNVLREQLGLPKKDCLKIVNAYFEEISKGLERGEDCLLYTSPSPRDLSTSRMPSSA